MNIGMCGQEFVDLFCFVGSKVVSDDMDLLALALICHDIVEERHEFRRGVAGGGFAQHLASFSIEGGVKRERSMSVILETMSLGSPWRQRQNRVFSIECLDRCLLIDAEYCSMLRRVQVEADHISCLGLEVWVVRRKVAFEPMRFDAMLGPDAGDCHVGDVAAKFGSQLAGGPVRGAVSRFVLRRARKYTGFDTVRHLITFPPSMAQTARQAAQPKSVCSSDQ